MCRKLLGVLGAAMLKEHFCLMNGAEKPCPGMNAAGECLAKE